MGFSRYTTMSSINNDSFTSNFSLDTFYFFFLCDHSGLDFQYLYRSWDSGHPCLCLDVQGKGFRFCPLSMMLPVGLRCVS